MTTVKQRYANSAPTTVAPSNTPGGLDESDPRFEPLKSQHTRGQAIVWEQNLRTYQLTFDTALATLRLAAVERDVRENTRHRYDRAHKACEDAAKRLATHTGKPVPYPAWIAPPTVKEENMIDAQPAGVDLGHYVETGGGKSGVKPGIPGTPAHDAWLNLQGDTTTPRSK